MAIIREFLQQSFEIGANDTKSRIAPVTQNGKPVFIVLSKTPTLQTPWNVSSFDGGERRSCDLKLTD